MSRKMVKIGCCDGECKANTLAWHLIQQGIIDRKWSHANENDPRSVFYKVKHSVSQVMYPASISFHDKKDGHCGVCFKEIQNFYSYKAIPGRNRIVNITDEVDLELPETIVAGCECITLGDELRALIGYLTHMDKETNRRRICDEILFMRERIDARCIISSWKKWSVDTVALPLDWFYFTPAIRRLLMLGQTVSGYGWHVNNFQHYKHIGTGMHYASLQKRNVRAYDLFRGYDKGTHRMCDLDTDEQVRDSYRYAILTRESARELHKELLLKGEMK